MNQQDWNHTIINGLDPALVEQASVPAKKRTVRPVRIAVVAACLCAALVVGAFAAETIFGIPIFKPMDTSPATGEPMNGFTTVIELPEETQQPEGTNVNPLEDPDINGVFKLPVSAFSQQVQDKAASLRANTLGEVNFSSWEKAEAFLGINLMDNPVLDRAEPGRLFYSTANPDKPLLETVCRVTVTAMDGILTSASTEGVWYLNREEIYDGDILLSSVPVRLEVIVQSYTKHSPIAPDEMFLGLGFPEDYTFTPETYTTPSGLVVNIVGVTRLDKTLGYPVTEYYAQFALNGNAVTISSIFTEDSDHALATLKEVLDAFQ